MGISRITDLTELDDMGSAIATVRPSVDLAQVTATQGKGFTPVEALTSALMEAAERFSCAAYRPVLSASRRELRQRGFVFLAIPIWVLRSGRTRMLSSGRIGPLFDLRRGDLDSCKRDHFPVLPSGGCLPASRPSTTGVAAGNTKLEALIQSISRSSREALSPGFMHGATARMLEWDSAALPGREKFWRLFEVEGSRQLSGISSPAWLPSLFFS